MNNIMEYTGYHTRILFMKMSREKMGFHALVKAIGEQFFKEHEDSAVFSYGEEDRGLFCFLGIDLHPQERETTLSALMDDWDVYASY